MYTAIYRDFRPDDFSQIIGQDHIVKILKNQLANGQTGHAYLFCGTRGTGKTTTARILAKALNCTGEGDRPCCRCQNCTDIKNGNFVDVVEIDAASNTGVDSIRDLKDRVSYAPFVGRYKVYIIDEVHMLSKQAFNALLKTLEEPPEHVVFILATTEVQQIPATILSRCIRLDFRRVSEADIIGNMRNICQVRGIQADDDALALIATNADGSVRDSLTILEQCVAGGNVLTRDDAAEILGAVGIEMLTELTERIMCGDVAGVLMDLNQAIEAGRDVRQIMRDWLSHFRNLLISKYVEDPARLLNMSTGNAQRLIDQSRRISTGLIDRSIRELSATISDARWSTQPRVLLEMCAVRMSSGTMTGTAGQTEEVQFVSGAAPVRQPQNAQIPDGRDQIPRQSGGFMQENPSRQLPPDNPPLQQNMGNMSGRPPVDRRPQMDTPENRRQDVQPAEGNADESDISLVWRNVVSRVMSKKPSLLRLENHTSLSEIDDAAFYVAVDDKITLDRINDNRALIEEEFFSVTGKRLRLTEAHGAAGGGKTAVRSSADRTADRIHDVLGIDVEIK